MKNFHHLIAKDIFNCLTEQEQEELKIICEKHHISREDYAKMKQTICSRELHEQISTPSVPKRRLYRILRYAAIFILPLSIASYFLLRNNPSGTINPSAVSQSVLTEKPQHKAVQLVLANGETVQLRREEKEIVIAPHIVNTDKTLEYRKDTLLSQETVPSYNQIIVPPAGEFNLRLADGTRIWLNEKTQLKYPVEFNQEKREIYLPEGEIYLEVAKDSLHPFIVHTANGQIEVLGTHFNVRCVSPQCVETTLAAGKVKVSQENKEVILRPGQQATVTDRISITEVDIEEVISWKDNLFYFKDTELETILNKLASWYRFEVYWRNPELKTKKFFMSIDKYSSAGEILNKLSEVSEVRFYLEGNIVNVSK